MKNLKEILVIVSILLPLLSCENEATNEQKNTEQISENIVVLTREQYENAGIETGELGKRDISPLLKINGKINVSPQSMISISVPLGGYLKSTKLLAGMYVGKGEVLAVMEDTQYIQLQQDYLTAKAQFDLIASEYNRQKELNQSKAASDKVFEQSKASYQMQSVLIKSLEEKLKLIGLNPQKLTADNISNSINVYSPIAGYAASINVNVGKYIAPSDVLFELVNPSDVHLTLSIFEKDIDKLAIGQKLFAYTNTNPNRKYPCKIILIGKKLSDQSSVEVHCRFEQYDESLLPGMFMNAEIELSGKNAVALPSEAIVRFENKHYVFIAIGNNRFEMREVRIGNSENNFTEIFGADSLVKHIFVMKGAYNLLMTMKNTSGE